MNPLDGLAWTNRFATLGADFFTELPAQGLPDPHWVAHSPACAELLGWPADWAASAQALAAFSGNAALPAVTVDADTFAVHIDGELVEPDPAPALPMAQRYFLF